jgi:histidyl-tRNA synthetase
MTQALRSIRGMNDVLPADAATWQHVEKTVSQLAESFGYRQIRTPILELTTVFKRAIGETTDVVEKEMYTFDDRNGDSLSMRPEGTAACVRSLVQHGLLGGGQQQKIWYAGPMFRHERPQKGRYRQFHQIGVEAFNIAGPDVDVELLLLAKEMWNALGVRDVQLEINSLGNSDSRARYRKALVAYFSEHTSLLDEEATRRLERNPLRLLDSKNPELQPIIEQAPRLIDYLDDASAEHFARHRRLLEAAGVDYLVNERLVRGLDYYSDVVFEWTTQSLGSQNAICSGGRYDSLVETQGGKPAPAVGFALGVERLIALMDASRVSEPSADIFIVHAGEAGEAAAFALLSDLRQAMPRMASQLALGGGSLKSQFKRADRSGAALSLVLGEQELAEQRVGIKFMHEQREQATVALNELAAWLGNYFNHQPG